MQDAINADLSLFKDLDRPKKSEKQLYWENRAVKLAILTGKVMVVVKMDKDNYQVWNKSIADKCGAEWCFETGDKGVVAV